MTASPTQLARLAIGDSSPATVALNYEDFDPGVTVNLFDGNRTKGTYDKDGNLVGPVTRMVQPRLVSIPTALEMHSLLRWGMGGTVSGTTTKTYPIGDDVLQQFVIFKPINGIFWALTGVACDVFTLSCQPGDGLRASLDLLGTGYTNPATTFPTLSIDQATRLWTLSQMALTYSGGARKTRSFTFSVNHMLDKNRFLSGSEYLSAIVKLDQSVTLGIDIPDGDNPTDWNTGEAGAAAVATFTNAGGSVLTISIPDVRFGPRSPVYPSKQEGFLTLQGECYRVGAGRPVTVTLTQ